MPLNTHQLKSEWTKRLQPLVGRKIRGVRYLTDGETADLGWQQSAVVIELDDATLLFPQADDEGNGPGALFLQPSTTARKAGLPDGAPVI
jgi:hypothetical protein